jgi:integrase
MKHRGLFPLSKLTIRAIEATPVPAAGQSFLWDGELRGFGVRFLSTGVKTFVLQYRNAEGRTRRMGLGRYGVLTVEQARDQARIKLGEVAAGNDPAQERVQGKKAITVGEVCDWFLEEAEAGHILGRRRRPIKASTLAMDRCRIETHIKPLLGSRQVRALKLPDIEKVQTDIASGKTAKPRKDGRGGTTTGGPGVAGRTVSSLRSIFAHAKRLGVIETNPALGVRVLASKKKERRLSADEIKALGKAMRDADRDGEHPVALAVVLSLLLTGFRISEAQGMKREWLNVAEYYVHFPDTKSDGQYRPIAPVAGKLMLDQPEQKGCPYVFPSNVGNDHYTAAETCLARLCKAAKLKGVTPHTLRHTFGSVAGDLGFSELTIGALLGHSARTVTQGYVHIDGPLRAAVEQVANEIAGLLDGASGSQRSKYMRAA